MSLNQKIAHNTTIQIGGKILSTVLGFLAVSMMARYLGIEQFGWYVTVNAILQFVGIFSDFGFTLTTSYLLSHQEDKVGIFNTLFTWRFISALVFYGGTSVIVFFLPYSGMVKLGVLAASFSFFFQTLNQVFIGYHQANLTTKVSVIGELLGRIVLIAGIFLSHYTSSVFLFVMASISLASSVYIFYFLIHHKNIQWKIHTTHSKLIFNTMWPTAVTIMFNAIYLQGDRIILPFYADNASISLYGASYRILDIVVQIAAIIMGILMPLMTASWAKKNMDDFYKHFQLSVDMMLFLLLPMLVGIMILAEPLVQLVGGKEFAGGGKILFVLSFTIVGIIFGMLFGHTALAINRQKQAIFIYASNALLSVIGYFIFIPRFGIYGAAGVTIFSELYAGIGLFALTYYYARVKPSLLTAVKIIIASAIMGIVVYIARFLPLFVSISIGALVYAALNLTLNTLPRQKWQEIVGLRKSTIKPINTL